MEIDAKLWDQAKATIAIGDKVACTVTGHYPFGVLVSLECLPLWGVIERIGMGKAGFRTPEEYPPVGSVIEAAVLGFRDYSRQVELVL